MRELARDRRRWTRRTTYRTTWMKLALIPRLLCKFFLALLACTHGHRRGGRSSAEFWYFPHASRPDFFPLPDSFLTKHPEKSFQTNGINIEKIRPQDLDAFRSPKGSANVMYRTGSFQFRDALQGGLPSPPLAPGLCTDMLRAAPRH